MTISSSTRKAGPFTGNGVTTAYPFAFKVFSASDLLVVLALTSTGAETVQTITTNYTVALNADQSTTPGGTVTMLVAPAAGCTLTLTSQVDNLQPTDLTNAGGFYPKVINDALDRATIQIQQLAEKAGRALQVSVSTVANIVLPAPSAGNMLGWDATGSNLINIIAQTGTSLVNLASSAGSSLVGFIQSGTGAVARTVQDELRDTVKVTQFYANGVSGVPVDPTGAVDSTLGLQAAINTGLPLDYLNGTYKHSGLSISSTGNIWWTGHGATLNYTGVGIGVKVQTPNNANAANFHMNGITFLGGANAFTITGQGSGIYSNIKIAECEFGNTTSSPCNVLQADRVQVIGNKAYNSGDVGFYLGFTKNMVVANNIARNCGGSAGIVVGYLNTYVAASNIDVIGNVVYCDDTAAVGNYIGGIEVVYANNVKITGNVIANVQTTPTVNTSIRTGIIVDEWYINDVDISNNLIVNPFQYGMFAGANATADIRRLTVKGNKFYKCGLSGAWFQRCNEGLDVVGNTFDTIQQHGVWLTSTCYDSLVANNTFRDVGIQNVYATVNGVTCDGNIYRVIDNTFYVGAVAITVTSTQPTPTYSIDPSTTTISLYTAAVLQTTYNYSGKTWYDVRLWWNSQTNWAASLTNPGVQLRSAANLRRTGPRNTAAVNQYAVVGYTNVTSAEPQYLVAATGTQGVIRGNKWESYAIDSGLGFDGANNLYSIGSDVLADTNSYGARQFQFASGSPGSLPFRYWMKGDRIQNSVPTVGQPKSWVCTTAGKYTAATFASEGNL